MYRSPPPIDSLNWSFELMLDVCIRIGLGKTNSIQIPWTVREFTESLNLEASKSNVRNWLTGHPIGDTYLKLVVQTLTNNEDHNEVWSYVIKRSALNIISSDKTKNQREKYFHVEAFGKSKLTPSAIEEYLLKAPAFTSIEDAEKILHKQRIKPVVIGEEILSKADNSIPRKRKFSLVMVLGLISIPVLYMGYKEFENNQKWEDIDLIEPIFTNIKFCKESDFDHDLNKCLDYANSFNSGIQKVNISFESTRLKKGARFNLRWYRYGERFSNNKKYWTAPFVVNDKYASTYLDDKKGLDKGPYHVRFFKGDILLEEAGFRIEEQN